MDIVERLRETPCDREPFTPEHAQCQCRVASKAADEIERLRDKVSRMTQACEGAWAIGHKVYHNANAHTVSLDWAQVRGMLAGVLNKQL